MRLLPAALAAVLLLPVLAACGEDDAIQPGDTVQAREVQQFDSSVPASLELPIGSLEVFLGSPRRSLERSATIEDAALTAPADAVFVPLTWQYDAATFGRDDDFIGTAVTPTVDLLSDGAAYRLQPPPSQGEGAESFYVLVTGGARDLRLRVEFAGVTQSVDLRTGDRDAGDASAIYEERRSTGKARPCDPATFEPSDPTRLAQFVCSVSPAERIAYAAGKWAPPGERWLVLTVSTILGRYDVGDVENRRLITYYGRSSSSTFRLGDEDAVAVIPDRKGSACPDPNVRCISVQHVVFRDPGKKKKLTGVQTVDLAVATTSDGSTPEEPTAQVTATFTTTVR